MSDVCVVTGGGSGMGLSAALVYSLTPVRYRAGVFLYAAEVL